VIDAGILDVRPGCAVEPLSRLGVPTLVPRPAWSTTVEAAQPLGAEGVGDA